MAGSQLIVYVQKSYSLFIAYLKRLAKSHVNCEEVAGRRGRKVARQVETLFIAIADLKLIKNFFFGKDF